MSKPILSKSSYIRSLQCLKALYLYRFHYNQRDPLPREIQARFERGHHVGKLAHQLFPGGVDASIGSKLKSQNALLKTLELIQKGCKIIYEASFAFDGVWVIADILVNDNGNWKAYEVKSSLELSETYMADAALQCYVISNALPQITGTALTDFSLIYINRNYVLEKAFDVQKYFLVKSVKDYCVEQTEFVRSKISKAITTLENGKVPAIETGEHCFKPYQCDFYGTCSKNSFNQNQSQKIIPSIDKFNSLSENKQANIYILEFLKARPAVPVFEKMSPYENILFHFTIGKMQGGNISYNQFTTDAGLNPNKFFIENLVKQTSEPGFIFVNEFDSKMNILNALGLKYPEYSEPLQEMQNRMKNIFDVFDCDENYIENINDVFQLLRIQRPFIKGEVFDKHGAIKAYMKMQTQDMFEVMDTKAAIDNYGLVAVKKLVEIISMILKAEKQNTSLL